MKIKFTEPGRFTFTVPYIGLFICTVLWADSFG